MSSLSERLKKLRQKPKDPNEIAVVGKKGFYVPSKETSDMRLNLERYGLEKRTIQQPVKQVHNSSSNELLKLFTTGALKWEGRGKICAECVNFYPDPNIEASHAGRCRARGFMRVHQETAAEDRYNYVHPANGDTFPFWPACPYFLEKDRLSRR